jgi:large subunit ribosomal protein L17
MAKNLITALFLNGRIVTTITKAKEYRPMAEKLITLAKEKSVHRMRQANASLGSRPAVQKLFDEIGPAFKDRPGGYTRIIKLAKPRLGDKGTRVYFELVNYVPPAREETPETAKSKRAPKETAEA